MLAAHSNTHILIVDRDVAGVEPLRQRLSDVGFVVRAIADASAAMLCVTGHPPHLVIVDWNMQGSFALDLIESARRSRMHRSMRIIILSALSGEHDIVSGLNLGADDYIAKPFSLREAVARVCAVLRPSPRGDAAPPTSCDELVLDPTTHHVTVRGSRVNLRSVEYRLLELFMSHPGRTFNRAELLARVWGEDCGVDERTVDVNVQRLRKILRPPGFEAYVQTVRGFGYRFGSPANEAC